MVLLGRDQNSGLEFYMAEAVIKTLRKSYVQNLGEIKIHVAECRLIDTH